MNKIWRAMVDMRVSTEVLVEADTEEEAEKIAYEIVEKDKYYYMNRATYVGHEDYEVVEE